MRILFVALLFASNAAFASSSFTAYDTTVRNSTEDTITFKNGAEAVVMRNPTYFVPNDPEYFKPGEDLQPFYAKPDSSVIVYQRDGSWALCYDGLHYDLVDVTGAKAFKKTKPIKYHDLDTFSQCE
ncbi:hypothetical protein [Vibrio alfacsensis]|uniref:hypothetical protein n=1 Tax=Vibrio alfacsensis TaxID=1074311 RepID=UPI0040686C3F